MRYRSRFGARTVRGALAGLVLLSGEADADSAQTPASFAIVSQAPVLEVRFRGVVLRAARGEQNQIALDFAAPVDAALFDRLQQAVPGWIVVAYGSYDNAVINASRPVEFLTRNEDDGFSLRLVAKQIDNPPSPPAGDGRTPPLPDGTQKIDTPFGAQDADGTKHAPLSERVRQFFEGLL
jgi:hypothetical protein